MQHSFRLGFLTHLRGSDDPHRVYQDNLALFQAAEELGFDPILAYPDYRDSVDRGLVTDTLDRYWDYQYQMDVFPAQPVYFSVTAFDVGDPQTGLAPLEASRLASASMVYPVDDGRVYSTPTVEAE